MTSTKRTLITPEVLVDPDALPGSPEAFLGTAAQIYFDDTVSLGTDHVQGAIEAVQGNIDTVATGLSTVTGDLATTHTLLIDSNNDINQRIARTNHDTDMFGVVTSKVAQANITNPAATQVNFPAGTFPSNSIFVNSILYDGDTSVRSVTSPPDGTLVTNPDGSGTYTHPTNFGVTGFIQVNAAQIGSRDSLLSLKSGDPTTVVISAFDYRYRGARKSFPQTEIAIPSFADGLGYVMYIDSTGQVGFKKNANLTKEEDREYMLLGGVLVLPGTNIGVSVTSYSNIVSQTSQQIWRAYGFGCVYVDNEGQLSINGGNPRKMDCVGGEVYGPNADGFQIAAKAEAPFIMSYTTPVGGYTINYQQHTNIPSNVLDIGYGLAMSAVADYSSADTTIELTTPAYEALRMTFGGTLATYDNVNPVVFITLHNYAIITGYYGGSIVGKPITGTDIPASTTVLAATPVSATIVQLTISNVPTSASTTTSNVVIGNLVDLGVTGADIPTTPATTKITGSAAGGIGQILTIDQATTGSSASTKSITVGLFSQIASVLPTGLDGTKYIAHTVGHDIASDKYILVLGKIQHDTASDALNQASDLGPLNAYGKNSVITSAGVVVVQVDDLTGLSPIVSISDRRSAFGEVRVSVASSNFASGVVYLNGTSGLTATNVQDAIDEVDGRIDSVEAHITDAIDAHDGSAISFDNTGTTLTDTNVQDALETLDTRSAATQSSLSSHTGATSGAHNASAIAYSNATSGIPSTNVQAAIDQIEGRVDTVEAHVVNATDAHDASAISFQNTTSGLTAVNVQTALDELDGRVDTTYAHLSAPTGAHAASAISYSNATSGIAATTVQAAIDIIEGRVDSSDAHIVATSGAHNASAIAYSNATSGIAATNVQTAIDIIEGRVDSLETSVANLNATSIAYTAAAGYPGGTTNVKLALDAAIDGANTKFNPTGSTLTSTKVQAAIVELSNRVDAGGLIFGTEYQSVSQVGSLATTTGAFATPPQATQDVITITIPSAAPTGSYRIEVTFSATMASNGAVQARLMYSTNGGAYTQLGSTMNEDPVNGDTLWTGRVVKVTHTTGQNSVLVLQARTTTNSATISDGFAEAWRVA